MNDADGILALIRASLVLLAANAVEQRSWCEANQFGPDEMTMSFLDYVPWMIEQKSILPPVTPEMELKLLRTFAQIYIMEKTIPPPLFNYSDLLLPQWDTLRALADSALKEF